MEHGAPTGGWTAPHDSSEGRTLPAATRAMRPGSIARERMFWKVQLVMVLLMGGIQVASKKKILQCLKRW